MIKNWRKYFWFAIIIPQIISAQFSFFGRNKVHYEKFNWKVLKTEHFNIYYYDDFTEIAEIGARYAEEAFEQHKVTFNHYVINKIPLIFYNTHTHFQQTNTTPGFIPEGIGGFFEFMKGRVVIPFLGNLAQFKHVIRHELVHVFMTNKVYNILNDHRITTEKLPPLWFTEGLAEYWSTDWDTQAEMIMRDAVLNGNFIPLVDLEYLAGYLMYKEGQKFLEFVAKNYGEDKILSFLENFWRFNDFKETIEFTLGDNIYEIDNKWTYSLRQKYFPLYQNNYPHFIQSKKITNAGFNFSPRYFSNGANGEIYFIGNRNGYTSLMKIDFNPDTAKYVEPKVLIEGEKDAVFEAFHLMENSISVSSKGLIALVTKSEENDVIHLYSIKEDKVVKELKFNGLIRTKMPSFSPSGDKIVFSAADTKGFYDLFFYDLKSDKLLRLTNDYYEDTDPIFNQDETKIIFSSDRTDGLFKMKHNLFEYDISSNEISYLTNVNANLSTPHFSPDYKQLYFTSDYDGIFNIWKINYDGKVQSGMNRVTSFITSVYDFTFVDNNTIVTSAFENFSFQFYSLDLNKISNEKYVAFNYDNIGTKWEEDRIKFSVEYDRLKYEKEYNLDYAVSQLITDPVYGTRGGALLSLSDLLGDERYIFYLSNTAEYQSEILKNFNVAFSRVSLKDRTNFGYGIYNYAGRRYDIRESDEYFYERIYGGYISLVYPFSTFQRFEVELDLANSNKEPSQSFVARKSLLLSNSLSFVHDNSLWIGTGPVDGSRFRFLLGYTSDVKFSNVNYYSLIADYRYYFRLGLRSCLAARAAIFVNDGKEARRYFAGGSWDLRGWDRWTIRGEKMWLSSFELRFPLVDQFSINFPFFGISLFQIRGALFFDAGAAWDVAYKETLGSVGGGIRINLFNVIALRYDIGKKIEKGFNQFQEGLFYQFFFGWDF